MSSVLEIAEKILRKYSLCDNCLGRFFARLGRGLTNDIRGRSIKTVILMDLFTKYSASERSKLLNDLREFAVRGGEPFKTTLEKLSGEKVAEDKCFVCGSKIKNFFEEYSERSLKILERENLKRFLIGVSVPREIIEREEEIAREFRIDSWESIKNELKREIGKRIRDRGYIPDFEDPDIIINIDIGTGAIVTSYPSALYLLRVAKLEKGYRLKRARDSLENILSDKLRIYEPSYIRLHLLARDSRNYAIREPGIYTILEIHSPKRGKPSVEELKNLLKDLYPFRVDVISRVSKRDIYELSQKLTKVIYEIKIFPKGSVEIGKLEKILLENKNTLYITQMTPTRLLERVGERIRRGQVVFREYGVENNLLKIIIQIDKYLFPEEFVTGDSGRTDPSLSSMLGIDLEIKDISIIDMI
ncbi:MAG: hypothetical protein ACP5GI_01365 [Sulfolobales archaeon]